MQQKNAGKVLKIRENIRSVFSASGFSDDGNGFPRKNRKVDIVEDFFFGFIGETDMGNLDFTTA